MLDPLLLLEVLVFLCTFIVVPHLLYYHYIRSHLATPSPVSRLERRDTKVSVVICTLNAADVIENKLEQILRQDYPHSSLELIVVDGGSTDGTVDILRKIGDRFSTGMTFRFIENLALKGKASQINEGFRSANGEIVVTTDADVEIHESAISSLVDSLSSDQVGAVCSRQVLVNPQTNAATKTEARYRQYYESLRIGESNLHSTPIFHGGLSGYRKDAVRVIDEDVNADDTQLALAALRNGFRAIYVPHIVFQNVSPVSMSDAWRQRVRRGQGLQRVFWRNRDMLFNRKLGTFGSIVFPAEFCLHLIAPLIFVSGTVSLIALAATLLSSSPLAAILGVSTVPPLITSLYVSRKWSPVELLLTFTLYQAALLWAMILHMFGHNYSRWSRMRRV